MSSRQRSRSPSYRRYSPSNAVEHSPPPPPRRYDDQRERDHHRVPPPRDYGRDNGRDNGRDRRDRDRDEYGAGRHGYDDRRRSYNDYPRQDYDDRVPPPRRYDNNPPGGYDRHSRDRDRDRDFHDSDYSRDRRDGGSGPRGPEGPPSEPSRDVIMLGLDAELTDAELLGFLRAEHGARVDSAKIVRDRATNVSKCYGFVQFNSVEDAQRFMTANHPFVSMPKLYPHSEPKRVKIDFAGPRTEHAPPPPPVPGPSSVSSNAGHDGTRDIGTPGKNQRVLLLRGLNVGTYVGEVVRRIAEEIARMLGRDFGVRDAETSIARVVMIVGRDVPLSWGFAFVELVTPELAAALLPFLLAPQQQPNGFLISQVPVAASFANANAFIPASTSGPGPYLVRAAGNGGIGAMTMAQPEGMYCTYWHQQAGAVETIPPGAPAIPARGLPVELSPETRAFLGALAGVAPRSTGLTLTPAPTNGAGIEAGAPTGGLVTNPMQPIKIGISLGGGLGGKKRKVEEDGIIPITTKNVLADDDDDGDPGKDSVLLSRTKGAKIIPPTSTSRKVMKNINKWNTKQVELAKPAPPREPPRAPVSSANATPVGNQQPQAAATDDGFDYTDNSNFATTGKVACLLCQRQFKSEDMARKHVAASDLHKARITFIYLDHAAWKQRKNAAMASTEPKYRDRAAERREVHHQPDRPAFEPTTFRRGPQPPAGAAPAQPAQPPPPPPPPVLAADDSNVGNKLLAKMGWTTGSGLGVAGEGRVEPVKVQQFDERVGLGAAKGREAGKWSGPAGWQERKKDMTKERYEAASGSGEH